jgi:CheY-like chemotaxis protein
MRKILVVDDTEMNSELLVETLSEVAQCDVRANGEGALEAYNQSLESGGPYDLILLDIAMPDISGIEVLKIIRAAEKTRGVRLGRGVPIIMVTAYKEPFMDAFNGGCDDYILKPIDVDKLIAKIEEKVPLDKK